MQNVSPSNDPQQQLASKYHEFARLAGGLAHEIKNPLSTILLNMELLAEEFADAQSPRDRRAQAKIVVMQRECQRLQTLLGDFLNYAKVRQLRVEATDLNEQVTRLVDFFAPTAHEAGIEIVCYLHSELPSVVLDIESFQGALMNLVLNAKEAMPQGGQLVFRTRPTGKGVALELIDQGIGMNAETQERIFDAFYSNKSGGSGLGLPTTRNIIEAHGGTITCQSEPGHGTQFTIELPALARLAPPPTAP